MTISWTVLYISQREEPCCIMGVWQWLLHHGGVLEVTHAAMYGRFAEKIVHCFHLIVWWIVETSMHSSWNSSMFPSLQIPSDSSDRSSVNSYIKFQQGGRPNSVVDSWALSMLSKLHLSQDQASPDTDCVPSAFRMHTNFPAPR